MWRRKRREIRRRGQETRLSEKVKEQGEKGERAGGIVKEGREVYEETNKTENQPPIVMILRQRQTQVDVVNGVTLE